MPAKITISLRWSLVLALSSLILALTSCNKRETQTKDVQKTFASPDDAAKALVEAAKSDNRNDLLAIFGPESKAVIYSGILGETRRNLRDLFLITMSCTAGVSWTTAAKR